MKNLTILLIVFTFSVPTFSQIQSKSGNDRFTESSSISEAGIYADSILSFQFTSASDSSLFQKEYNTYIDPRNHNYESWTWNNFSKSWSGYLGSTYTNEDTTTIVNSNWNTDSANFIPSGQSINVTQDGYFFNAYYYYDINTNLFIPQNKSERWTNVAENDSVSIEYNYNIGLELFEKQSKTAYLYDTLLQLRVENRYSWLNNNWVLKLRIENGYDTLGNHTYQETTRDLWGTMVNQSRKILTYDSLNNLVNSRLFLFNNNQWVNERNEAFQFDEFNRNILFLSEKWNIEENKWIFERKTEYEYGDSDVKSADMNMSTQTARTYAWNTASQNWDLESESLMEYNELSLVTDWIEKRWDANTETYISLYRYKYDWNIENRLLLCNSFYSKNNDTDAWGILSRKYYYYNGINVFQNVLNFSEKQIKIFPNPTSDVVHIKQEKSKNMHLIVYNMFGQKILNISLSKANTTIDISGFENGQYLFTFLKNNRIETHKLLKIK